MKKTLFAVLCSALAVAPSAAALRLRLPAAARRAPAFAAAARGGVPAAAPPAFAVDGGNDPAGAGPLRSEPSPRAEAGEGGAVPAAVAGDGTALGEAAAAGRAVSDPRADEAERGRALDALFEKAGRADETADPVQGTETGSRGDALPASAGERSPDAAPVPAPYAIPVRRAPGRLEPRLAAAAGLALAFGAPALIALAAGGPGLGAAALIGAGGLAVAGAVHLLKRRLQPAETSWWAGSVAAALGFELAATALSASLTPLTIGLSLAIGLGLVLLGARQRGGEGTGGLGEGYSALGPFAAAAMALGGLGAVVAGMYLPGYILMNAAILLLGYAAVSGGRALASACAAALGLPALLARWRRLRAPVDMRGKAMLSVTFPRPDDPAAFEALMRDWRERFGFQRDLGAAVEMGESMGRPTASVVGAVPLDRRASFLGGAGESLLLARETSARPRNLAP